MQSLIQLIDTILVLYQWAVILAVIVSWLIVFQVINTYHRFVYILVDFLDRITEPVLRRIRRVIPAIGSVDLSPLVLLLGIWFARSLLREYTHGYFLVDTSG